jgi:CRISPR-associated protein Csm3
LSTCSKPFSPITRQQEGDEHGKQHPDDGQSGDYGRAAAGLDIGGVDNPIIRHPVTREPYIPGSSLRGKIRALLERAYNLPLNKEVQDVRLHECNNENRLSQRCAICHVFGISPVERERGAAQGDQADRRGEWGSFKPTRLVVRDVNLAEQSRAELETADTDLPYSEVKWEASIDRITSAAVPRQNERVPAGARFEPFEMIYTLYRLNGNDWQRDADWLAVVFEGMRLLEDDYLGGLRLTRRRQNRLREPESRMAPACLLPR